MTDTRTAAVDALLDAYTAQRRALHRVLRLVASHPDHLADEPAFVLLALDADPDATALCPPTCTGDCTPDPVITARLEAGLPTLTDAKDQTQRPTSPPATPSTPPPKR